jgi:hypothetical protein
MDVRQADGEAIGRDRRTEGPTAHRPPEGVAVPQGRPTETDGCPVRRRPSTFAVRPPAPSALYDGNFFFLDYVFTSLIAVT